MWVGLGGAESIRQSWAAGLEFELVVRARAESCVESLSRMTSQRGKSGLFGDQIGIADRSGIGVASNCSRLSRLESTGIEHVAESQGGLGDRGHEEGSPRRVFESKGVVFAISGARIAAIASASCQWNAKIHKSLLAQGFTQTYSDASVYGYSSTGDHACIIVLYVDDLLLLGNSKLFIDEVKRKLKQEYQMTDLGPVEQFLGLQIC